MACTMKLGILAYATDTGLGNQTRDYVKHLNPDKVMAVDISRFNKMPVHEDWYPRADWVRGIPTIIDCDYFVQGLDIILVAETPLNYDLYHVARKRGVKIIQAYNYEFLDYFRHPEWEKPDILAAPSDWNLEFVKSQNFAPVRRLNVPTDIHNIGRRHRTECKTFIHIVGRPAAYDRNGTIEFLEAARRLPRFKYKIYLQPPTDERAKYHYEPVRQKLEEIKNEVDIELITNAPTQADLYKDGDVLVLPRRYGGLCLPMQEALAAGMPVIMTDISPNDSRLPKGWLCDAEFDVDINMHAPVKLYRANIDSLVGCMLHFEDQAFMSQSSDKALNLSLENSWEQQLPKYQELFNELCA